MNIAEIFAKGIYLPALISSLIRMKIPPVKETTERFEEYDYIIIGSGPGGSVLANRLSEDSENKVLLLEAGKSDNISTVLPAFTIPLMGSGYDWFYETVPQKHIEKKDNKCHLPSGKVIGGSSTINYMVHSRGNKLDYDEWFSEGNIGWSYDDVLPYFKKHENYLANGKCIEDKYHGCGGELTITSLAPGAKRNITDSLLIALKELGYNLTDINGEQQIGITNGQFTITNGKRLSAATAFLRPVQNRTNFHIFLEAFVHKVVIDPKTKIVIGVEYEKNGILKQIKAKKEVILSSGTYSSPKILMLSGIGPKEELEKFKIPVIVDLPGVGQNLQEPLAQPVVAVTGNPLSKEDLSLLATKTFKAWIERKEGLLTSPSGIDALMFLKTKYENKERPDIMMVFNPTPFPEILKYFIQRAFHISKEEWEEYYGTKTDQQLFSLVPTLLRPQSRGTVKLKSNDPHDDPLIDPRYFEHENDRIRLLEGIRIAQEFINMPQISQKGYKFDPLILERCKQYEFNTDEYLMCTNKYLAYGVWSGCCTNKMGPNSDKMAVVDQRLRVKGIKGLRVVDVSVFPNQVSAMPAATMYMIGEKSAEMIKEDN